METEPFLSSRKPGLWPKTESDSFFRQPPRPPQRALERDHRLGPDRHLWRSSLQPGKKLVAHNGHLFHHAARPRHRNLARNPVLALQLSAHQQHEIYQVSRRLMQHLERHRIACLGQFIHRRRQRRKVRARRAVTQAHQVFQAGRAPNLAHLFQNLRRLLAVVSMQPAPHAVYANPIARALVPQPRAIPARAFPAAIGRPSDRVRARSGNLQDARATLKRSVQRNHFIAHHFGALHLEVLKNGGDPFHGPRQTAAGHATAGSEHSFDARLRIHIGQQFAQVRFRNLRTDTQPLDGTAFSVSQNSPLRSNHGAGPSPSTVNSKHNTHSYKAPSIALSRAYFSLSAPPSRSVPASTFKLPSVFGGVRPSRCASHGYRFTFSKGWTVFPSTISGPAAKKLAFISGSVRGSYPCAPAVGGWSVLPVGGACARMAYGPVAITTGS